MFTIKTLNAISPIYKEYLAADEYDVSPEAATPDAIIVRNANMHDYAPPENLKAVARAGAGYNNIPHQDYGKKGIVVFNTPGANANAVRELAVAGMLLASRDICAGIEWVKTLKGKGAEVEKLVEKGKGQFVGPELRGKTLGVVGLGEVGAPVANAGKALDMNVIGYDPYITVQHAWMLSRSITRVKALDELLAHADYISIHVPLSEQTRHMFDAEAIGHMKRGAVLLNFSRGELVDNAAMFEALASGQLSKYVTDFPTDELIGAPGVIAIPHLGASTPESEDNCVVMASRQIDAYLKQGVIKNSVNYPDCELGESDRPRVAILHANVPNVVASLASAVASLNINIDNLTNRSRGDFAYSVMELDDAPGEALIRRLRSLEHVYGARLI